MAIDVEAVFDWLVDGALDEPTAIGVMSRTAVELRAAGIPLDRVEAFVRTLHPHIVGRSFVWAPNRAPEVHEQSWAFLQSPEFASGPIGAVFASGAEERRPTWLADQGFTDFVALPLRFRSGESHAITFATRAPGGFTAEQLAACRHVLRPLSRVAEILALRRTAENLLDTYVGHQTGARILAGRIVRGSYEPIDAVLWFSDLRGFTQLSGRLPTEDLLRVLDDLFECQVPAIEAHDGEVLKFMGDGLLAIFPLAGADPSARAEQALAAADGALLAAERVNARRRNAGEAEIRFGIALHVGQVSYGNIGGADRLDFTCIGPAVNLASRLEGLTGQLSRGVILSEEFAQVASRPTELLGRFELKGIDGAKPAFGLRSEGGG